MPLITEKPSNRFYLKIFKGAVNLNFSIYILASVIINAKYG